MQASLATRMLARTALRSAPISRRYLATTAIRSGVISNVKAYTPVEVFPLIALVSSACVVGVTLGVNTLLRDKTLRVHHNFTNDPLVFEAASEKTASS